MFNLHEMTFYVEFKNGYWDVLDHQLGYTHGSFSDKSEAYQFCREMNN